MARRRRKNDEDDDRDSERRSAEAAALLAEATRTLPPEAALGQFRELLGLGQIALAWEELRGQAERFPMGFAFWVQMSKAADLLGGE